MEKANAISFIGNKQSKQEQPKSFKEVPEHNKQVPFESEILEIWRSIRERREPSCHLEFVMETNVAFNFLTEDGKSSNY